jgi:hypothetical protein
MPLAQNIEAAAELPLCSCVLANLDAKDLAIASGSSQIAPAS